MSAHQHINAGGAKALPLDVLLSAIPSLPRPLLERLVQRAIDKLDSMDPDPDLEDSHDQEWIDEREPEPTSSNAYRHAIDQRHIVQHCRFGEQLIAVDDFAHIP